MAAQSLYCSPLDPLLASAPDLLTLQIQICQHIHDYGYATRIKQSPHEGNKFKGTFDCSRGFDCPFKIWFERVSGPDEDEGEWWEVKGVEPDHSHPPTEVGEWKPSYQLRAKMREAGVWDDGEPHAVDQAEDDTVAPQPAAELTSSGITPPPPSTSSQRPTPPSHTTPLDPATFSAPTLLALHIKISKFLYAQGYTSGTTGTPGPDNGFKGKFGCAPSLRCPFAVKVQRVATADEPGGERWEVTSVEGKHNHAPAKLGAWKPTFHMRQKMDQASSTGQPQAEPGAHDRHSSLEPKAILSGPTQPKPAPQLPAPASSTRLTPLDPATMSAPDLLTLQIQLAKDLHAKGYVSKVSGTASARNKFTGRFGCTDSLRCPFSVTVQRVRGPDEPGGELWQVQKVQPSHNHSPNASGEWKPNPALKVKMKEAGLLVDEPEDETNSLACVGSPSPAITSATRFTPHNPGTLAGPDNLRLRINVEKYWHARGYQVDVVAISSAAYRPTYKPPTLSCLAVGCRFKIDLEQVRPPDDAEGEWWEATPRQLEHNHLPADLGEWQPSELIRVQMKYAGMLSDEDSESLNSEVFSSDHFDSDHNAPVTTPGRSSARPARLPRVGDTFASQWQVREAVDDFLAGLGRRMYVQQAPKLHRLTPRLVMSCCKPQKHCAFALVAVRRSRPVEAGGERWEVIDVKGGHGIYPDDQVGGSEATPAPVKRAEVDRGSVMSGAQEEERPSKRARLDAEEAASPQSSARLKTSSTTSSFDTFVDSLSAAEFQAQFGHPMPGSAPPPPPLQPGPPANAAGPTPPTRGPDDPPTNSAGARKRRRLIPPELVSWPLLLHALGVDLARDAIAAALARPELDATPASYFSQPRGVRWQLPALLDASVGLWPRTCFAYKLAEDGERVWREMTGVGEAVGGAQDRA